MSGENPKVLLVDDDKDLLQLIAMRLSATGYNVNAVESGEAALASLAVSRPQVVVTDLRMQGMDGMALFDAIHRDSPSRRCDPHCARHDSGGGERHAPGRVQLPDEAVRAEGPARHGRRSDAPLEPPTGERESCEPRSSRAPRR